MGNNVSTAGMFGSQRYSGSSNLPSISEAQALAMVQNGQTAQLGEYLRSMHKRIGHLTKIYRLENSGAAAAQHPAAAAGTGLVGVHANNRYANASMMVDPSMMGAAGTYYGTSGMVPGGQYGAYNQQWGGGRKKSSGSGCGCGSSSMSGGAKRKAAAPKKSKKKKKNSRR